NGSSVADRSEANVFGRSTREDREHARPAHAVAILEGEQPAARRNNDVRETIARDVTDRGNRDGRWCAARRRPRKWIGRGAEERFDPTVAERDDGADAIFVGIRDHELETAERGIHAARLELTGGFVAPRI